MKKKKKNNLRKQPPRRPAQETHVGKLFRTAREKRGLVLLEVEAETGLYGGGISFIENGRSVPDLLTAYILCKFYGITLDDLAAAFLKDSR